MERPARATTQSESASAVWTARVSVPAAAWPRLDTRTRTARPVRSARGHVLQDEEAHDKDEEGEPGKL